jgi:hypothetical protein
MPVDGLLSVLVCGCFGLFAVWWLVEVGGWLLVLVAPV